MEAVGGMLVWEKTCDVMTEDGRGRGLTLTVPARESVFAITLVLGVRERERVETPDIAGDGARGAS